MSNLIKSVYFNVGVEEKRVIDSDQNVESFIPNIYQQTSVEEDHEFKTLSLEDVTQEEAPFQAGINVINMDNLREEERDKLSQEKSKEEAEEYGNIIKSAKEEAVQILIKAQEEAKGIQQEAYEEGYKSGYNQGREDADNELVQEKEVFLAECNTRIESIKEMERQLEPKFGEIMIQLMEKITGVLCENKKDIILYLIHQSLHQLEKTKQVTLRISKVDMMVVSEKKEELKALVTDGAEFHIQEDGNLKQNQCIIETENKIIDCSLDAQLENLGDHIRLLSMD